MSFFARIFDRLIKLALPDHASSVLGAVHLMRSKPTAISEVKDGELVTISGRVEAIESLASPLLQKYGVGYHFRADKRIPRPESEHVTQRWNVLHDEQGFHNFWLVDDDGLRAFVDAQNVLCAFKGYESPPEDRVKAFLEARGVNEAGTRAGEFVVEHGAIISVRGVAAIEVDPEAELKPDGYRGAERAMRLRITSGDEPVTVSDWVHGR